MLPDDDQEVLIVRALQSEIDEIERSAAVYRRRPPGRGRTGDHPAQVHKYRRDHAQADAIAQRHGGAQYSRRPAARSRSAARGRPLSPPVPWLPTRSPSYPSRGPTGSSSWVPRKGSTACIAWWRCLTWRIPATPPRSSGWNTPTPPTLADQIAAMVQALRPQQGSQRAFSATADETTNSIILIGSTLQVDQAP